MSRGKPKFSVIVPTYNRAHLIERAIDSVLRQSLRDFEIVVVDDGSNDETPRVVAAYGSGVVAYARHSENAGQSAAVNRGIAMAAGEVISFLDSDDEWKESMLEDVSAKFQANPDCDCVHSFAEMVSPDGRSRVRASNAEGMIYCEALTRGCVTSPTTLSVRKESIEAIGGMDTTMSVCNDDDLCIRLAKKYRFGLVKKVLARMHGGGPGQMTSNWNDVADGWFRLFDKHREEILKVCGGSVLAEHYTKLGRLFLLAGNPAKAREVLSQASAFGLTNRRRAYLTLCRFPPATSRVIFGRAAKVRGRLGMWS